MSEMLGQHVIDMVHRHIQQGRVDIQSNSHEEAVKQPPSTGYWIALLHQGRIGKGVYNSYSRWSETVFQYLPKPLQQCMDETVKNNGNVLMIVYYTLITIVISDEYQELGVYLIPNDQPLNQVQFERF